MNEQSPPTDPPSNLRDRCFRLGDALVNARDNLIETDGESLRVGPRDMDVLVYLAERQHTGEVVRTLDILDALWSKSSRKDAAVMRCIFKLREALGDSKDAPRYIKTHYGQGYRLLEAVEVKPMAPGPVGGSTEVTPSRPPAPIDQKPKRYVWRILAAVLAVTLGVALWMQNAWKPKPAPAPQPPYSLAILALRSDGLEPPLKGLGKSISEELIFALGQIGDFELVSRATAFPLGEQGLDAIRIGEILDVEFVLDGRIVQQDGQIRVVAEMAETRFGRRTWGNSFLFDQGTVPSASSKIAEEVARAMRVVLNTKAQAVFDQARDRDPAAYREFVRASQILRGPRAATPLKEAIDLFSEALRLDPDFVDAQAGLCRSWVALYRLEQLSDYFQQAQTSCNILQRADANTAPAGIALGMLYREQGDQDASIEALTSVVNAFPRDVEALVEQGDSFAADQRNEEALETYLKAIELAPNEYDAQAALGVFYYRTGKYEQARQRFIRASALNPGSPVPHNSIASSHYVLGNFKAAAREWRKSIEIRPTRIALTNLGLYHYYAGEFSEAENFQRKALTLAPTDHRLLGRLAESLRFQPGKEDEMRAVYEEASQSALTRVGEVANDEMAYARLGNFRANLGELDRMRSAFATAHSLSAGNGAIYYIEAVSWAALKNVDETLRCLESAARYKFDKGRILDDPDIGSLADNPKIQSFLAAL